MRAKERKDKIREERKKDRSLYKARQMRRRHRVGPVDTDNENYRS
jgi:hypothetical protein